MSRAAAVAVAACPAVGPGPHVGAGGEAVHLVPPRERRRRPRERGPRRPRGRKVLRDDRGPRDGGALVAVRGARSGRPSPPRGRRRLRGGRERRPAAADRLHGGGLVRGARRPVRVHGRLEVRLRRGRPAGASAELGRSRGGRRPPGGRGPDPGADGRKRAGARRERRHDRPLRPRRLVRGPSPDLGRLPPGCAAVADGARSGRGDQMVGDGGAWRMSTWRPHPTSMSVEGPDAPGASFALRPAQARVRTTSTEDNSGEGSGACLDSSGRSLPRNTNTRTNRSAPIATAAAQAAPVSM